MDSMRRWNDIDRLEYTQIYYQSLSLFLFCRKTRLY